MSDCAQNLDEVVLYETGPQGAPANAIIETGAFDTPVVVVSSIAIPPDLRARLYITCDDDIEDPAIDNGSSDPLFTQELFLYYIEGAGSLSLNTQANLILSGEWQPETNSVLSLQWLPTAGIWTEVNRNEI